MGAEQPEEQRWKAKYRALLDEQAANDEHTDALRHAIVRLSHVAAGQSEDLDDLLQELRHKVRHGSQVTDLQSLIGDIDSTALDLEQRVSTPAEDPQPPQAAADKPQSAAVLATETKASEPAFTSISERVEGVLIDMVSKLKVPESVAESKQRIEKTLKMGLNWYELIATLEELSLIVAGTLYEGEKDYAGFLQQTISSLAELHSLIKACQLAEQENMQKSKQLERSINDSLQSLCQSLESDSIEDMKAAVQVGLDNIAGKVQEFNDKQESSALEMRENVHALTTQVLQLQQEIATAHKQIEQHKFQATTDPLTKLPNRSAYEERLELEYKRWIRYHHPLTVAVGDIDFFKKVNDTYGHVLGDEVLRTLAGQIKGSLRETDFVTRYGGEEFVFLLPETCEENAMIALNKLRSQIQSMRFNSEQGEFSVTMSFGISAYRQDDNANMAFTRADQALYAAKQQGRNCCVLAQNN